MLGRTHFVLGMASALAITHPQTVSGVITAMAAGALGGWIVDVDIKNRDVGKSDEAKRESVYDLIIDSLFLLAFFIVDFFTGKGMCQYVIDNWGLSVWGGGAALIALCIVGLFTKHRTFTHSFLALGFFSAAVYFFCRPAAIAFFIGYGSHLIADFFNKLGLQLFFPLKWRPCLKLCRSDKKANRMLFWIALAVDIVLGAYLFSKGMLNAGQGSALMQRINEKRLWGLNLLEVYLIFINILTFIGFERSHHAFLKNVFDAKEKGNVYNSDDYETPELRFETWLLDLFVFLGGGVGMLLSLIIHLELPAAYNGNWWAFCYTSILFWFTVYFYVCNPFGLELNEITWLSTKHIPILLYIIVINVVTVLFLFKIRKKRFKETDIKHTLILLLGALGGTAGAIPMVFVINRTGKYYYVIMGFFVMLISQIAFILYMMMAGFF